MSMTETKPSEHQTQTAQRLRKNCMFLLQSLVEQMKPEDALAISQQIDSGAGEVVFSVALFAGELQIHLQNPVANQRLLLAEIALPAMVKVDDTGAGNLQ